MRTVRNMHIVGLGVSISHRGNVLLPQEEGELGIPVNAKGVPWDVDVTARFFGYSMIGFPLTELIPRVFDLLHW